jgi:predicted anti-sigma-YlaC factor YlaD
MNCQLCQNESKDYREGKLSGDLRIQVERHLQECPECTAIYEIDSMADNVINREKEISPGINLTARIMDRIENLEDTSHKISLPFMRVLQPALILTSMAAAIFVGVLIGSIYKPSATSFSRPVELSLMDDAAIEFVNILSNE